MKWFVRCMVVAAFFWLYIPMCVFAQGMPPAQVVVSEIRYGTLAPQAEFIGTVYYQEISDVASEVSGLVESVSFEEGQRIKENDVLVKLVSDLLEKTSKATVASYEQALVELDSARRDMERADKLHGEKLIADKTYDDFKFRLQGLEKKAIALKAEVERMELELQKKTVTAPFDGIIIRKHVNQGEWLSTGAPVATVAKADIVDVIVEVPGNILPYIKDGMSVRISSGGKTISGKVFTVIPRGDVETRTFPVKIRINNTYSLIEGMEAKVLLPTGRAEKSLTVSRDAIIRKSGQTFIYIIADEHASMIPVRVTGYSGVTAGITADGLSEGMKAVVKGNERLMNGQPVNILNSQNKK